MNESWRTLKPVLEQAFALQQSHQAKTTELDSRVTKLEKELAELKQSQISQSSEKPASQTVQSNATRQEAKQQDNGKANQASQSKAEPVGRVGFAEYPNEIRDEVQAEKWVRENMWQWLDQPCTFGKAKGRTWRDLAENKGEKIPVRGIGSAPRVYLHAIANWRECKDVWGRLKAKVVLDMVKDMNGRSHYSHPAEIGG